MTPACYNRPPARGFWVEMGRKKSGADDLTGWIRCKGIPKPVLRYVWPWFEDKCATWDGTDIGKTPETARYPQAHGWDCRGCRLLPTWLSTDDTKPGDKL